MTDDLLITDVIDYTWIYFQKCIFMRRLFSHVSQVNMRGREILHRSLCLLGIYLSGKNQLFPQ